MASGINKNQRGSRHSLQQQSIKVLTTELSRLIGKPNKKHFHRQLELFNPMLYTQDPSIAETSRDSTPLSGNSDEKSSDESNSPSPTPTRSTSAYFSAALVSSVSASIHADNSNSASQAYTTVSIKQVLEYRIASTGGGISVFRDLNEQPLRTDALTPYSTYSPDLQPQQRLLEESSKVTENPDNIELKPLINNPKPPHEVSPNHKPPNKFSLKKFFHEMINLCFIMQNGFEYNRTTYEEEKKTSSDRNAN